MAEREKLQFSTPEEEIAYLKERVAEKERMLKTGGQDKPQAELVSGAIEEYAEVNPHDLLSDTYALENEMVDTLALGLSPDRDDETIMELLGILKDKGVRNALSVAQQLKSPHITDDFHRALVQYVRRGLKTKGLNKNGPLWRVLNMTLYEVALPEMVSQEDRARPLRELISSMEQFYMGMLSIADKKSYGKRHFSMEIAVSDESDEIIFYISVPTDKKDLFEKHILSIYPNAELHEQQNDFNIFVDGGSSVISSAKLGANEALPIRTYDKFDYDPLNVILNVFSKIEREGGGAALQIIFSPAGEKHVKRYKKITEKVRDGESLKEASKSVLGGVGTSFALALTDIAGMKKEKKEGEMPKPQDQDLMENLQAKTQTPILDTNIRFAASAQTSERASEIIAELESSFNQFENTSGNAIRFRKASGGAARRMLSAFTFRQYNPQNAIPLSIRELSTLLHFPAAGIQSSPQFKQSRAGSAPAPPDLPQDGTLLGVNTFRNKETKAYVTKEDRLRHFYVIGQTGTGKTTLLKNMIVQDIRQGEGVCFIDPHGNDIQDVLASIPRDRMDDVIYFDPAHTERVMGLNMLEYDPRYPEQKTFVINEMFAIFQKLYGAVPESMGPMFEQYFRNGTALVVEDPESGSTLMDISRVLSDRSFRQLKLERSNNVVVNHFWEKIGQRAGGESSLENIVPYIVSKFDGFIANDIMRPVVGQQHSTFNFREVMDSRKILLVNLSKGRLGDINSNLIGLVLVSKILMAALSRAEEAHNLPPFYLYIDEFQNVTTNSVSTILSEARKYKLSLTVAHQFIAQLQDDIKTAVFGNVGNMVTYRVGAEDAEFLEKQFHPVFSANDIMNLENYHAYIRILAHGTPTKPFNIKALPPSEGAREQIEELKQMSYQKYGVPREEVEKVILDKYLPPQSDDDDEEFFDQ